MGMEAAVSPLPDDVAALKALLNAATRRADEAEARLANAKARESATEAMIAHLKLQIAKLKREAYGASAERSKRLLAQMELQLEDLEADASEDELVAEAAAAKALTVAASSASAEPQAVPRSPAARAHRRARPLFLPGMRQQPPCQARRGHHRDAGGNPAAWKVIQTVREKFSCRDCEKIARRPRPSMCSLAAGPGPASSPCCCSRSSASTSRSTARPNGSPARACR
jgi:transposase